jgi:hypothetical protein
MHKKLTQKVNQLEQLLNAEKKLTNSNNNLSSIQNLTETIKNIIVKEENRKRSSATQKKSSKKYNLEKSKDDLNKEIKKPKKNAFHLVIPKNKRNSQIDYVKESPLINMKRRFQDRMVSVDVITKKKLEMETLKEKDEVEESEGSMKNFNMGLTKTVDMNYIVENKRKSSNNTSQMKFFNADTIEQEMNNLISQKMDNKLKLQRRNSHQPDIKKEEQKKAKKMATTTILYDIENENETLSMYSKVVVSEEEIKKENLKKPSQFALKSQAYKNFPKILPKKEISDIVPKKNNFKEEKNNKKFELTKNEFISDDESFEEIEKKNKTQELLRNKHEDSFDVINKKTKTPQSLQNKHEDSFDFINKKRKTQPLLPYKHEDSFDAINKKNDSSNENEDSFNLIIKNKPNDSFLENSKENNNENPKSGQEKEFSDLGNSEIINNDLNKITDEYGNVFVLEGSQKYIPQNIEKKSSIKNIHTEKTNLNKNFNENELEKNQKLLQKNDIKPSQDFNNVEERNLNKVFSANKFHRISENQFPTFHERNQFSENFKNSGLILSNENNFDTSLHGEIKLKNEQITKYKKSDNNDQKLVVNDIGNYYFKKNKEKKNEYLAIDEFIKNQIKKIPAKEKSKSKNKYKKKKIDRFFQFKIEKLNNFLDGTF